MADESTFPLDGDGLREVVWDECDAPFAGPFVASPADAEGRGIALSVTRGGEAVDLAGASLYLLWRHRELRVRGCEPLEEVDAEAGKFRVYWPAAMARAEGTVDAQVMVSWDERALSSLSFAVLAVTSAGYVRTRVARVRDGLTREKAAELAALLNHHLTFVAAVDLNRRMLADLCSQISPSLVPVISAAAAILQESATPRVYLGGEPFLLNWPQLDGKVQTILTLLNDEAAAARIIAAPAESTSVLLGEDMEPQIPGLSVVSCRYLVGGGLYGSVALVGPTRMPFSKVIPLLEAFADELGEGMAGKRKDTPQAAVPRAGRKL